MNIDFNSFSAPKINLDLNALTSSQPRGLYNFISEIRSSKSKEDERARVDKELANIRQKFAAVASLTSRDKKKYVWKMCYMYMLGYDIDFGHLEFISLLSSTKFQEKAVGYMAFSLMLRPGDELMTLVVNSMRNDLIGQLLHGQTLALAAVSNIGGTDLAEALAGDVQRLITANLESRTTAFNPNVSAEEDARNKAMICKKASLCLLRLFRTNPDCIILEDWVKYMARLIEDRDVGVITSLMSLLLGFASHSPAIFEPLVPYVISILNRLATSKVCSADYLYYRTPCPWLQVKCLRFLQYYKIPSDRAQLDLLNENLLNILVKTEISESLNKSNADHSILFEGINLVISYGSDAPVFLKDNACALLGRYIGVKDANIRYLGLDAMTRLAKLDGPQSVQMHQTTVLESLKDADISVRKRGLNLIYVLTDRSNAQTVVAALLQNLSVADAAVKEDMVVKIAILAEKYSSDLKWYVNTMIQVMQLAGDFVAEAVWYRVVQIVTNNPDIHEYAAQKLLASVEAKYAHDNIIAVASYLLGEIGVNICEQPGMSGRDQFNALHQHFHRTSLKVQCILLTTYMKLLNLYPEQTSEQITAVFRKYATSRHVELQQRACEYLQLPNISAETMEAVLNPMPMYELSGANEKNALVEMSVGTSHVGDNADRPAFTVDVEEKNAVAAASMAAAARNGSIGSGASVYVRDNHSTSATSTSSSTGHIAAVEDTTTAKKPAAAPVLVDLLSMDDDVSIGTTSHTNVRRGSGGLVLLSEKVEAELPALLRTATIARGATVKSVLLQNEVMKISISSDYRAHQARLALYFDNNANYDITNLKVVVSAIASSAGGIVVKQQDPPVRVVAGDEGRMQLALECMRPFADNYPLTMDVRFSVNNTDYHYNVSLPVSAPCFYEALPTDKATYMARWKSIEGENTEAQVVFSSAKPIDGALMHHIRTVLVPSMKLGLAADLDNEKTVTGCSSFLTGTMGADGKTVAVGVMMRLEGDPGQNKFRITVRAKHPAVAQALRGFIVEQLGSN